MRKEKTVDDDVLFVKLQEKTKLSHISNAENCITKYLRILTYMATYYLCISYFLFFF